MNNEEREEEAYSKGHYAHYNGYTLKHNPYKRFTPEWEEWRGGWYDESRENPYWEEVRRLQRNAKRKIEREINKIKNVKVYYKGRFK